MRATEVEKEKMTMWRCEREEQQASTAGFFKEGEGWDQEKKKRRKN